MTKSRTPVNGDKPLYFSSAVQFRRWLATHHASAEYLWVGFYKKGSGRPSLSWPESVDQALCFGWIDGIRKSVDQARYTIRFTPRRAGSIWSAINRAKVAKLTEMGMMQPAGLSAFRTRDPKKSNRYSFERGRVSLPQEEETLFRKDKGAWEFFQSQAPWYRRTSVWWVVSAKQEATREKRLKILIADSGAGRRIAPLRWSAKK